MMLSPEQQFAIYEELIPKLLNVGLFAVVSRSCNPEDGIEEDCLVVFGSTDGPYRTSKRVGTLLLEVDDAFADLLVVRGGEQALTLPVGTWEDVEPTIEGWNASPASLRTMGIALHESANRAA